jgi:hypothetical protein
MLLWNLIFIFVRFRSVILWCAIVVVTQSWHWETRQYHKWSVDTLRPKLLILSVHNADVRVSISEVKELKAEVRSALQMLSRIVECTRSNNA